MVPPTHAQSQKHLAHSQKAKGVSTWQFLLGFVVHAQVLHIITI